MCKHQTFFRACDVKNCAHVVNYVVQFSSKKCIYKLLKMCYYYVCSISIDRIYLKD